MTKHRTSPGILAAMGAAALFGCGTPLAKQLLGTVSPWMLAGLFYLGSGIGLTLFRRLRRAPPVRLPAAEWRWLAGAIASGGVAGPVLLMAGLSGMAASSASLLLNAEGVFTALLAWFVFRENFDRRIALGMAAIVAGAVVLGWPGAGAGLQAADVWPALAVLGACLAWGLDNNLTRKVSLVDATWVAAVKGMAAGLVNVAIALAAGAAWPAGLATAQAMAVGCLAYGVSLALFVVALRHLGTSRTGAYFSLAPFFGAALSVAMLGEPVTAPLLAAAALMGVGVWLHLTERHAHSHRHEVLDHAHAHRHDDGHHDHADLPGHSHAPGTAPHSHWHRHEPQTHAHAHFPDAHHRHGHGHGHGH